MLINFSYNNLPVKKGGGLDKKLLTLHFKWVSNEKTPFLLAIYVKKYINLFYNDFNWKSFGSSHLIFVPIVYFNYLLFIILKNSLCTCIVLPIKLVKTISKCWFIYSETSVRNILFSDDLNFYCLSDGNNIPIERISHYLFLVIFIIFMKYIAWNLFDTFTKTMKIWVYVRISLLSRQIGN